MPINAAYASTQHLGGPLRFVMGASGHIAGVINPPAKKKRSHWIREDGQLPASHTEWLAGATEHAGSWWDDWSQWLAVQAGERVDAPKDYGRAAIEAAPGRYVREKAGANR
ncbi:Poly-beta-hydroxybutyrate polymerase [compost metagenome]